MDILYHYCSPVAFREIVANREIWLSSAAQSNDYLEGSLVSKALERLCKADDLDAASSLQIIQGVASLEREFDGLCLCLSEAGDLLSQWRGYAADARGVSIGFSKPYLERLVAQVRSKQLGFEVDLTPIRYAESEHEALVRPTYEKLKMYVLANAARLRAPPNTNASMSYKDIIGGFAKDLVEVLARDLEVQTGQLALQEYFYALKAPSFSEEREWRMVSYITQSPTERCLFRADASQLVPYRSLPLLDSERGAIAEVILGPKHTSPIAIVEKFLNLHGFEGTRVRTSYASYR